MKYPALTSLVFTGLMALTSLAAHAQAPKRDLLVQLRQVEDARGVAASTQSREPLLTAQQIQVRNGEKASLRMGQSIPMHWVKSLSSKNASLSAGGATASETGGSVVNEITWMESGQSLSVLPRWPGGKQPVLVEIEVQSASVEARIGADLPAQSRNHTKTTMTVPLGEWVTIALTGGRSQPGVYGTDTGDEVRRLLQIRVQAQ